MSAVDVMVADPSWREALPDVVRRCRRAARLALGVLEPARSLAILLTDDAQLQELNRRFRGVDRATNVLAFRQTAPTGPEADRLGDVAVAFGVCAREAGEQGKTLADHLSHLVIHGVLHLAGHDHDRPRQASRMEAIETDLLARLAIADPYLPR
ncbi:MAG TPA: rRNA maturation RNase YbeY [Caulobacteraceae bacterium]|nr:rRNA maturation RNase YbeY [Caulobacteraceae bacterium]